MQKEAACSAQFTPQTAGCWLSKIAVIRHIRGVDSDSAIETLMSRGLIAEDPRFGGRGRPAFLVTTVACLRLFGVGSLAELPSLAAHEPIRVSTTSAT